MSRAEFERNLAEQPQEAAFTQDVLPLVGPGHAYEVAHGADLVRERLLARFPGPPWRGAG